MKNRLLLGSVLNTGSRFIKLRQRQATEPLAATLNENDSAKINEQTDDKKARTQNGTFGFC